MYTQEYKILKFVANIVPTNHSKMKNERNCTHLVFNYSRVKMARTHYNVLGISKTHCNIFYGLALVYERKVLKVVYLGLIATLVVSQFHTWHTYPYDTVIRNQMVIDWMCGKTCSKRVSSSIVFMIMRMNAEELMIYLVSRLE